MAREPWWGALAWLLARRGATLDDGLRGALRGFPDDDAEHLRERPCRGLVRTLRRRLRHDHRTMLARRLPARLDADVVAGSAASPPPPRMVDPPCRPPRSRSGGDRRPRRRFDVTPRASVLASIDDADRPGHLATATLARLVYLPMAGVADQRERLAGEMVKSEEIAPLSRSASAPEAGLR